MSKADSVDQLMSQLVERERAIAKRVEAVTLRESRVLQPEQAVHAHQHLIAQLRSAVDAQLSNEAMLFNIQSMLHPDQKSTPVVVATMSSTDISSVYTASIIAHLNESDEATINGTDNESEPSLLTSTPFPTSTSTLTQTPSDDIHERDEAISQLLGNESDHDRSFEEVNVELIEEDEIVDGIEDPENVLAEPPRPADPNILERLPVLAASVVCESQLEADRHNRQPETVERIDLPLRTLYYRRQSVVNGAIQLKTDSMKLSAELVALGSRYLLDLPYSATQADQATRFSKKTVYIINRIFYVFNTDQPKSICLRRLFDSKSPMRETLLQLIGPKISNNTAWSRKEVFLYFCCKSLIKNGGKILAHLMRRSAKSIQKTSTRYQAMIAYQVENSQNRQHYEEDWPTLFAASKALIDQKSSKQQQNITNAIEASWMSRSSGDRSMSVCFENIERRDKALKRRRVTEIGRGYHKARDTTQAMDNSTSARKFRRIRFAPDADF